MKALLLLLLSWSPVVTDCRGGPEPYVHYDVMGQHVRLLGWETLPDGTVNPIYSERQPIVGATAIPELRLSDEPLLPGDVAFWEVTAVDVWGNRSDGPCL